VPRSLFLLFVIVNLAAIAAAGLVSSWFATCGDARTACLLPAGAPHVQPPARW
jgi:hypothetical protein